MSKIKRKEHSHRLLTGTDLVIVTAVDDDNEKTFKDFDLRLVSVTPEPQNLEFSLKTINARAGVISFKGCLDHEVGGVSI